MTVESTVDHPIFARLWTAMTARETPLMRRLRAENLAGLSGRVLEVGAGTGTNFGFYPRAVSQVLAVEPEKHLADKARQAAVTAPVPVTVVHSTVGALDPAEPFDAVVCSLVLCSVAEPEALLRELSALLIPGGELRFFEHVASAGWRGRLQRLADLTVWPRIFGNCHTHRATEQAITAAGFSLETTGHQWMVPAWVPLPVSEIAVGRAVSPGQPRSGQ